MKLFKIAALALCLNVPMAYAGGDQSCLRTLAKGVAFTALNVAGAAAGAVALLAYEGTQGGLSEPHTFIATVVISVPTAIAIDAAASALNL
jgi:hypothetical protein